MREIYHSTPSPILFIVVLIHRKETICSVNCFLSSLVSIVRLFLDTRLLQLTAKRNMHDTCALTNKKKKKIYLYIGNSNHSMLSRAKEREENSNTFFSLCSYQISTTCFLLKRANLTPFLYSIIKSVVLLCLLIILQYPSTFLLDISFIIEI